MPPPPPPPPAPPPPAASAAPPAPKPSALLKSIEKGAKLKKVQTNDRSAPIVDAGKPTPGGGGAGSARSPPMPRPPGAGAGASIGGGAGPQLGGLFAGGMPKLRSTGRGGGDSGSEPPIPKPPKPANDLASAIGSHMLNKQGPPPTPSRPGLSTNQTSPASTPRSSIVPPTPPRSSEPPPLAARGVPAPPSRGGPPPVPDRSNTPAAATMAPPPTPSRPPTIGRSGPPPAPPRSGPPSAPGSAAGSLRGPPPAPPARGSVRDAFEKPAPPASSRPTPPPPGGFGGLKPSGALNGAGFGAARDGLRSSSSTGNIASYDQRESDPSRAQTETIGRWTFRTDLPSPRQYPSGASSDSNALPARLPPSVGSPSMGRRPPPPPPPASRRGSAARAPPPPVRSREGSVGQAAEITKYADDTLPKLETSLERAKAEEDYLLCANLKKHITKLTDLKKRAISGGSVVMILDDYRTLKAELESLL